jgi:hypothetical protein
MTHAIHLVSGGSAAGHVRHGTGATRADLLCAHDLLTVGPCDADPERHLELRRAFRSGPDDWMRPLAPEELRAAVASDRPIGGWATTTYDDVVWLWWALDTLGRLGAERQRIVLSRPRPADPHANVGGSTPDEGQAALTAATGVSDEQLHDAAELWRRFASPSPLAFDEGRRRGSAAFPELTASAELHGAWFPRLTGGRLHLSELDELLLARLEDTWRTTSNLICEMPARQRLLSPFGSLFSITRLRAWADRGAIAREPRADENPFTQDVFRRTDRTRALLEHGIKDVAEAPSIHVGGCLVNDPESPWVRVDDASGWRISRP